MLRLVPEAASNPGSDLFCHGLSGIEDKDGELVSAEARCKIARAATLLQDASIRALLLWRVGGTLVT